MHHNLVRPILVIAVLAVSAAGGAVPPPPPQAPQGVRLPASQCRVEVQDVVRAYAAPSFTLELETPTILRVLPDRPDADLYLDMERADGTLVVAGAGLSSGDLRIAISAPGPYLLRVGMRGDAARTGKQVRFGLALSHAMESAMPACPAPG